MSNGSGGNRGSVAPGSPAGATVTPLSEAVAEETDAAEPTAGEVLHRVLAQSARSFLLNDAGLLPGESRRHAEHPANGDGAGPIVTLEGPGRSDTEVERVHQSRVACRRIRSNLRTFRLLVAPAWSTTLRAELAWFADQLGGSRDLEILRDTLVLNGPLIVDEADLRPVLAVLDRQLDQAEANIDSARKSDRYGRLIGQMLLLWDGPLLTEKADKPADPMLANLVERAWRDVQGAARTAKKKTTDDNLHKLRVRLKGLRYGAETAAEVDGKPARRVAKAVTRLQTKLGDLHDACLSVEWLLATAVEHPELSDTTERLCVVQRAAASVARKGWKDDLKEVERRWRKWQG